MKKLGLFCGIDRYEILTELKCAVSDTEMMDYLFRSALGYKVQKLRNEECTANEVRKQLRKLGETLEDGDTFVFYFAGHGVVEQNDDYYCMQGADDALLKSGHHGGNDVISYRVLRQITDAWATGVRKVFILDACRHQANRAVAQGRLGMGFYNDPKHDQDPYRKGPKIDPETLGILLSCQTGQGAQELHSQGQGLLVSAFKAEIEANQREKEPLILDAELERKLDQRMKQLRRKHNLNEQTPWLFPPVVDLNLGGGLEDEPPLHEAPVNSGLGLDERQWKLACLRNTVEAYEGHLGDARFECVHVDEALARIAALENAEAEQANIAAQATHADRDKIAEALREQAERDAAEAERKKKAAEEARLATLAEEEIARRKQAEAEEQGRISQVAQRAEEARLAKEKQAQEAEAKRQKQEVERHQSDEQAWKDTQKQAAASRDFAEKKRLYQAYANRWTLYREQAQSLAVEQDSKIKKAEAELTQEQEAQRLKAEQAERAARETAEREAAEREAAEKAERERRKTAEVAQPAGAVAEPKSGIPGWAWGLGIVVLGYLASIPIFGGEKAAAPPLPAPVTAKVAPVPVNITVAPAKVAPAPTHAEAAPAAAAPRASSFADPFAGEMVAIPITGRPFNMGDNGSSQTEEMPAHPVTIRRAYELGRTEVTQGQWKAVMGNNPSTFKPCGDNCPVETVRWTDIQQFIKKLNEKTGKQYRLPTEAEWEYACRAGGTETYCGSNDIEVAAWYDSNSGNATHKVAQKQKNAFGLYDMSGNVWEWVQDCYHDSYNGAPDDGSEWKGSCTEGDTVRVLRGGSWNFRPVNARSANRFRDVTSFRLNYVGFRLARMLP